MKISAIYKIQSKLKPERCYVGSAVNINSRWEAHKRTLRLDKHHSQQLQRHVGKYGIEDLVFIIIEPCFPEFLIIREQYYIDTLKPYFNSCKIAGSTLGIRYKLSDETKLKYSKAKKGIKLTEEHKRKISEGNKGNTKWKGRCYTEESKEKIRNSLLGVKHTEERKQNMRGTIPSEETKQKMRAAKLGKKHSEEHKKKISDANVGKKRSNETKKRMSISQRGKQGMKGEINPMYGKHHSEETRKKISLALKERKFKLVS